MAIQRQINFCGPCSTCFTAHRCGGYSGDFIDDPALAQKRLCLSSERLGPMLSDLGGLNLPTMATAPLPDLPNFIPQLTNPWFEDEPPLDYRVVAIGVSRVFNGNGSINRNLLQAGSVQGWLNLRPETHVVLIGCAKDRVLENVWEVSRSAGFYKSLRLLGFTLMTALNFSIYFNEPRLEHLVNLKRSAVTALEAGQAGIMSIPHVHWARALDIERMAEWLRVSDSVEAVAFNMQTYRKKWLWGRAMDGILRFASLVDRPLTYMLIGVSSFDRVEALSHLPKVVLVSAKPFMKAQHYEALSRSGTVQRHYDVPRALLFYHNLTTVLGGLGRERKSIA